ncbi:MAG: porin [Pseudomonadota bacterium]
MKKVLILAVAALALLAMSAPAQAVDPSTYTFALDARMLTDIGWQSKSRELTKNGSEDVGSWFVNMPGHSYLRARFYSVDKNVGGHIELGLSSVQPDASVSLRYAYGYWRVGNCRILAGQTDNWFGSLAYHIQQYVGLNENSHLLMFGWGFVWPHRVPQVQFTYNTDTWGVQFALEEPRNKGTWDGAANVDTTFILPRMTLTFMFKYGAFMTHPGILFVKHDYEVGDTGAADESWDTLAIVLPIKFTAGAFTLKFQGHWGKNFATEIPFYPTNWTSPVLNGSNVEDTTIWGAVLAGEYSIGKLMITGGFGYENFSNDTWLTEDEITRWGAFIAVPYQFTKNFGIHPEFSYYKYGDNPNTGEDMGNEWLLGVQFRFVF